MTGRETYLLAMYLYEADAGSPVPPGVIADLLDKSPAAVTQTIQRFELAGLVTSEPYEGATLTCEGTAIAETEYETYLVLVRFFDEVLALESPEYEALSVVGSVSNGVADRLAEMLLDSPTEDPDTPNLSALMCPY